MSLCYQVISLVIISNIFGILNHVLIEFVSVSKGALASEAICVFFVNLASLINILFVKRQWITTRKQLYRQAVTVECKEKFRNQIKVHTWLFNAVLIIQFAMVVSASITYYIINYKSYMNE